MGRETIIRTFKATTEVTQESPITLFSNVTGSNSDHVSWEFLSTNASNVITSVFVLTWGFPSPHFPSTFSFQKALQLSLDKRATSLRRYVISNKLLPTAYIVFSQASVILSTILDWGGG